MLPPLGFVLIWLLYLSCRHRYEIPKTLPEGGIIVAFWHGELLMQPFLYRRLKRAREIRVMISDHFDGEIIARIMRYFGFGAIRGSSSKGGVRALKGALGVLQAGGDVAITPDGPRGPRHSVADGIVAIAQKTGAPIVVLRMHASRFWQLSSWDGFMIPKPFGVVTHKALEPFGVCGLTLQEARTQVRERMLHGS